jgi:phosphoesterase RecJ-like protein
MSNPSQRLIDELSKCKRVLVTTHVRPDGDALGSAAAMAMGMKAKGIDSDVLLLSHLPRKYAFVFVDYAIPFIDVEERWPESFSLDRYDALLVVDTGTWSQLPGLKERVGDWPRPKLVLDHHLTQENWADEKLVQTNAAAAGEIVAALFDEWGIALDARIATALYLAIASDTGWFQFSSTRPYTMRLAAKLMEAGVNTDRLYQLLYQSERPERLALQARAMQSMQLLADGRLAVLQVWKKDFEATKAIVPDTENLINVPLQIGSVEVSMLITEPGDFGPVRVSLRSKGKLDVAKFAEQFGGGGHARASGLKLEGLSMQEAHDRVVAALTAAIKTST